MSAVLSVDPLGLPTGGGLRMLIVERSSMIRSRISRLVQGGGMPGVSLVGLARNAVEAVRIARGTRPDVVTLDLTMPEMDGIACIGELLKLHPELNILVVSALSDKGTALAALERGARGVVAKPFSDDELKTALLDLAQRTHRPDPIPLELSR